MRGRTFVTRSLGSKPGNAPGRSKSCKLLYRRQVDCRAQPPAYGAISLALNLRCHDVDRNDLRRTVRDRWFLIELFDQLRDGEGPRVSPWGSSTCQ
jgi:hypothetical protein